MRSLYCHVHLTTLLSLNFYISISLSTVVINESIYIIFSIRIMFYIYSNIFYIRRTVVYLDSFQSFGFQLCEFFIISRNRYII